MRSPFMTALRYVAFAVISTAANFGSQQAALAVYGGWGALAVSMIGGTGIGFVVKYVLDKLYIFDDRTRVVAHEARKIGLYGLTAIVTTMIFWSMELGFLAVGKTVSWKFIGGALGLAIGYTLKYFLDRRWVFKAAAAS